MNLVLLSHEDFTDKDRVRLAGRRLRHVRDVLRSAEEAELAVGVLGGRIGQGRIVRMERDSLEMKVRLEREPPSALPVTVILALPRPKVLRRALFTLTVLGVKKIVLLHAARVEKSYWQSPVLAVNEMRRQFLRGLEQAGDTILPEVLLRPRFRPFVEDELPDMIKGSLGLVAHPSSEHPFPRGVRQQVTLAIGPEGGFVPFEVDLLRTQGLEPASAGQRIMHVESVVPALLARLF